MNATKPQPAPSVSNPKAPPSPPGAGTRRREAEAVKAAPAEATTVQEEDFEHHDTIPAPTWFDDGTEGGSS